MPELCVLHANCQGEVLETLLRESHFARHFLIHRYVNYTYEPIPAEDLARCRLFLYQPLGQNFGDLASDVLLSRLSGKAEAIPLPNLFFKGYWPFWYQAADVIEFADSLLEHLLAMQLQPKEILAIYLSGAHPFFKRVEEIAEQSLALERQKEQRTPIKTCSLLEADWRDEALFYTVNHPGKRLSLHVAQSLLALLDLPRLSPSFQTSFVHPDAYFHLPVHPVVGKRLRLRFTGENVRFRAFSGTLTHKDFVVAYLACRLNQEKNLLAFLNHHQGNTDSSR